MMDSIDNARKLIEYGNLRMIGGNSIAMKFVSNHDLKKKRENTVHIYIN